MTRPQTVLNFHRDERGFTLIETLVAMISATVVVGALYAILIVSVDQTSKVTDTVYATQAGRTTMTKFVDELRSACISSGFVPIKEGVEKEKEGKEEEARLTFVNAYGSNAEITSALKHEIVWEKSTGLLVDKTYSSNGGSSPEFTYPSRNTTYTETRLGENISQTEIPETEKEEKEKLAKKFTPIFQYYKYSTKSTGISSEGALSTLERLPLTTKGTEKLLSGTEPAQAAAVEISFRQAPIDKEATESRTVDFKDLQTLSFSVPNAETPIEDKPCE